MQYIVYILGAIGGKEVVLPLLKSIIWAVAYDCEWVTEELPSIFGKKCCMGKDKRILH